MSDPDLIPKPCDWNVVMMEMAFTISRMSKDPRTQVGAVLVSPDRTEIAVGWNGFPQDFPDYRIVWDNRDINSPNLNKYDVVIHAEENAILNCHVRPQGWTLYCTHFPCVRCAAIIKQVKIAAIYYSRVPDTASLGCAKAEYLLAEKNPIPTYRIEV